MWEFSDEWRVPIGAVTGEAIHDIDRSYVIHPLKRAFCREKIMYVIFCGILNTLLLNAKIKIILSFAITEERGERMVSLILGVISIFLYIVAGAMEGIGIPVPLSDAGDYYVFGFSMLAGVLTAVSGLFFGLVLFIKNKKEESSKKTLVYLGLGLSMTGIVLHVLSIIQWFSDFSLLS